MPPRPVILAIVGPTASGKSSLALGIADQLQAEIVSADSRQIYRRLDIGTAKPSIAERERVLHHFVDIFEPNEEYSAGAFGVDARAVIIERLTAGFKVLLCGGSGLYLRAVIDGLFDAPPKDVAFRTALLAQAEKEGPEVLLELLRAVDPRLAEGMDPTKLRRIIRALEVHHLTGRLMSELHDEQKEEVPPLDVVQVGLNWPREELYARIDNRVDAMLRAGLVDEVRSLRSSGFGPGLNALNTVGYKEVFEHLDGRLSVQELGETIKRNTRHYAKRQLTWFRADERIRWLDVAGEPDEKRLAAAALKFLDERRAISD